MVPIGPFIQETTTILQGLLSMRPRKRRIAAALSSDDYSGNDNALRIASLIDTDVVIDGQNTRFSTFISTIMNNIGGLTKAAQQLSEHEESSMKIMEQQRESRSGVSMMKNWRN